MAAESGGWAGLGLVWTDVDDIRRRLDEGADPEKWSGGRPLHRAAVFGSSEVVAESAGRVADVDALENGVGTLGGRRVQEAGQRTSPLRCRGRSLAAVAQLLVTGAAEPGWTDAGPVPERPYEYDMDESLRIIGVTSVPDGCVVTQPWGYAPQMPGVLTRLSADTVCYGLDAHDGRTAEQVSGRIALNNRG